LTKEEKERNNKNASFPAATFPSPKPRTGMQQKKELLDLAAVDTYDLN